MKLPKFQFTPAIRKRLYEVAIAALAVAILYGYVAADQADVWLVLVAAVLGVARKNVNDV